MPTECEAMNEKIGFIFSLFWRCLWCMFPFVTEYAKAAIKVKALPIGPSVLSNESLSNFATTYSYSVVILGSLIFLIIGSTVGYFYPTPQYGLKPYPKWVKVLISVGGGLLAFVYYLEVKNTITPAVIWWVAGVSFVFPAIIHLIHAAAIKATGLKLMITDKDLKRIIKSFGRGQEK
jgi:hypothetical protein